MSFSLTSFRIIGLHKDMDVNLQISNNTLVIVASNGLGKTTIVNIIYYTLSQQWLKLVEYQFKEIGFTINNQPFKFTQEELVNYFKRKKRGERNSRGYFSTRHSRVLENIFETYSPEQLLSDPNYIETISSEYGVPAHLIYDVGTDIIENNRNKASDVFESMEYYFAKHLKTQILYLPTYRRIEKDLKNILPDLETNLDSLRRQRIIKDKESSKKHIELVEFGMDDVQNKVDEKLNSLHLNFTNTLKQSLMGGYLKAILNKEFENYSYASLETITTSKLTEILERIDKSILQNSEKISLIRFIESYKNTVYQNKEDKIIAYFIQKLVDIYEDQSLVEADVVSFVDICNTYCANKNFFYSREERKIKIYLKQTNKEISFSRLSSGEKQVVSLFSHLYLSDSKSFFVIIDEPELSLSVSWQERFLTDIKKAYNSGIIAVTHSPFIFTNELESHTKSFNEFIRIRSDYE